MTKIEELKAAYEAATLSDSDIESYATSTVAFLDAACNTMPLLLEAVGLLESAYADNPGWRERVDTLMEKLK